MFANKASFRSVSQKDLLEVINFQLLHEQRQSDKACVSPFIRAWHDVRLRTEFKRLLQFDQSYVVDIGLPGNFFEVLFQLRMQYQPFRLSYIRFVTIQLFQQIVI